MAFQFGGGTGGFSFGTPAASAQGGATAFGASTQPSFSFSTPTLQSTPASLGGATTNLFGGAGQTGGVGLSFGSSQPQAVTGGFGISAATQPASSAPAFSFGANSLFGNAGGTSVPTATTANISLFGGAKAVATAAPSVFGAHTSAPGVAGAVPLFSGGSSFGFSTNGQPAGTATGSSFGPMGSSVVSVQPSTTTAAGQPSGGFSNFGSAPATSTTGFSFGGSAPASSMGQTSGFAFGQTPTATTSGGGFLASTVPQQPASTANQGISFGSSTSAAPVAQPPATGFSFLNAVPPSTAMGSLFGGQKPGGSSISTPQPATTSSTASSSGSLLKHNSTAASGATALGSLNFGSAAVPSATSTVGSTSTLSGLLGASSTSASSSALGSLLAAPAAGPAFGQAFGATPSVPAAAFGTTQATPTASSTSAVPASFGLGLTATATSAASAGFGLLINAAASSAPNSTSAFGLTLPTSSIVCTSAASTATSSSATCKPACSMTYRQLEESINKWSIELEEQEAIFLEQATQVNAWDRLLIDNGEKISQLNSDVECVKIDQARLTQELDFILGQQRELEDLLTPLEQVMDQLPPINYQQHADVEREHTYKLAENIDAQLKQMATDLKEIVEHLNVSSGNQDSCDPLVQISKILNAHVDSLQWIDHSTELVKQRMDSVSRQLDVQRKQQINKLHIGSN